VKTPQPNQTFCQDLVSSGLCGRSVYAARIPNFGVLWY